MDSSPAKNKPSIPSRPNLKPRNSETGDTMRRSFCENPSPADSSRRNSIGRESNRVECGDKENQKDKDQISNVVRAPKCAKNFMSPTISAVSKINPSPRKRILSDKNDVSRSFDKTHHQVLSSVSFSEDKDHDNVCIDERKKLKEESHDIAVTDIDEKRVESSLKISPFPPYVPHTFHVDQSLTPYDPKKNYLSPRPQFLHYRPNPRIDHHFDECKQLEELFISESSSCDTDLSAEESQQEDEVASQEGVEEETQDKDGEEAEQVVGESVEEETHQISTQSRFKTWRLLGLILALCLAYLLLVPSTASFSQPTILKDSPFYEIHISTEIIESTRESFKQLSVKLRMWADSSLVYLDKLISSLREEEEGYGVFRFYNLTDTFDGKRLSDTVFKLTSGVASVAEWFEDSKDWSLEMDIKGENVGHQEELENSYGISLEAAYEEDGNEMKQESQGGEVNYSEMVCEFDAEMKGGEGYSEYLFEQGNDGQETYGVERKREYEQNDHKYLEECPEYETIPVQNDEKENMEEAESNTHQLVDVESVVVSGRHKQKERQVYNYEVVSEEEEEEEEGVIEHDGIDLEEKSGFGEAVHDEDLDEILLSNKKKVIVLLSTVMVLLLAAAAASFLLAKKKAKMSYTNDVNRKRELLSSLPCEMSFNFYKNKPFHRGGGGGGEGMKSNDSVKSMASSAASEYSIGSVSYGSYTTYEKIQIRSGNKEEEKLTPVRRSSRIKNSQQHSEQSFRA